MSNDEELSLEQAIEFLAKPIEGQGHFALGFRTETGWKAAAVPNQMIGHYLEHVISLAVQAAESEPQTGQPERLSFSPVQVRDFAVGPGRTDQEGVLVFRFANLMMAFSIDLPNLAEECRKTLALMGISPGHGSH